MLVLVILFVVSLQLSVGLTRRDIVSSTFDELLHEPLGYALIAQYVRQAYLGLFSLQYEAFHLLHELCAGCFYRTFLSVFVAVSFHADCLVRRLGFRYLRSKCAEVGSNQVSTLLQHIMIHANLIHQLQFAE